MAYFDCMYVEIILFKIFILYVIHKMNLIIIMIIIVIMIILILIIIIMIITLIIMMIIIMIMIIIIKIIIILIIITTALIILCKCRAIYQLLSVYAMLPPMSTRLTRMVLRLSSWQLRK